MAARRLALGGPDFVLHVMGTHWLRHGGTNNVALALISFESLAAYETYRARLKADPAGAANFRKAHDERFILSEERTFLRCVERM